MSEHLQHETPPWRDSLGPWLSAPDVQDKHWTSELDGALDTPVPVEQVPTPSLTLDTAAVAHNLGAMQRWVNQRGLEIAPHGKTTMAPGLWQWQLDSGSWGITVANIFQLRVARFAAVPRVLVANQIVSPDGLQWLGAELSKSSAECFDVTCWADSLECVAIMDRHLRASGANRPLGICLELGSAGGRTGVRDAAELGEMARAVLASPVLELRGVSAYEGSVKAAEGVTLDEAVGEYLASVREVFVELRESYETAAPILTAGGSAWFDIVAQELAPALDQVTGTQVVLRSGAYAVHDHGHYFHLTPAAARSGPEFMPAAHAYARVLSRPEPGLALLDAGKRDIPYDIRLPQVLGRKTEAGWENLDAELVDTNDQHAYLTLGEGQLEVGDLVCLGMSHPCTMFDKSRSVLVVEDDYIVGALRTYF